MQKTLCVLEETAQSSAPCQIGGLSQLTLPRISAAFLTLGYHSIYLGSCAGSQLPKTSPGWKHARLWLQLTDCQQTSVPV